MSIIDVSGVAMGGLGGRVPQGPDFEVIEIR
jgi:hypothetical protein